MDRSKEDVLLYALILIVGALLLTIVALNIVAHMPVHA
jgi:hypothetical protein